MPKAKKHHYLSQFYLSGFTSNGKKDGDLFCFDLQTKKVRKSRVKEEGYEKYFNRIESNELDENYLENELSKFESSASELFRRIVDNKTLPKTPEDWGILFYYLALLAVRNPAMRETLDDSKTQLMKVSLEYLLANSSTWDNYKNKLPNDKFKEIKELPFLEVREKLLNNDFKLISTSTENIKYELPAVNKVTELLSKRRWSLIDASGCSYDFITSDRPVKLFWDNEELNKLNRGPGFGMKDSALFFPLEKKFYLVGRFDNKLPEYSKAKDIIVSAINTMQFNYSNRYLFGPKNVFYIDSFERDMDSSLNFFR